MIKLSKTSKMPGKSWSLPALTTCPGAREGGQLVEVCQDCYATKGFYHMPSVKAPREHNMEDWKRDEWAADMIAALSKLKYFRWFDSGDCYDVRLATKILEVVKGCPDTKFWLPTRMHKFEKFLPILREINNQPNCVVRLSGDRVGGPAPVVPGFTNSKVIPAGIIATESNVQLCNAPENKGKCGDCRACWNDSTQTVAYRKH